jgi:L-histidine Nalpha-methyltransferase
MSGPATVQIDVHLTREEIAQALLADAQLGLTSTPKELPPKWFYDEVGCGLFDQITRLPEYYPTRREREILEARAGEIAQRAQADTLVELGSGTSEKTRLLLDALSERGALCRFVPFDVSETVLRQAAEKINGNYQSLEVHGIVGDFERHLFAIPDDGRRLIAFLGSTIGNFPPPQRALFLRGVAASMNDNDALLIGFDLVKDVARLEAAYNDAKGITAAFNRNVLNVLNRELDADFDPDAFDHVARFDPHEEWIEMLLRSTKRQQVKVGTLALDVEFQDGEEMRTEISAKFRPEGIKAELEHEGLHVEGFWTDESDDFGLVLASKG